MSIITRDNLNQPSAPHSSHRVVEPESFNHVKVSMFLFCFFVVFFVMGVFMLPITVKSNDVFSALDSSSLVILLLFITLSCCVAIYCMYASLLYL